MASAVETAIQEIDAALAAMAPIHEGLRDYSKLNIQTDTLAAVNGAISQYDHRKSLLEQAKARCEALVADGYPVLDIADVTESVKKDLEAQAASITAALAEFDLDEAATLVIVPGSPSDK